MDEDNNQQVPQKKAKKGLFFTEKIMRMLKELKTYTKSDRLQYRTDIKALLCRGIEEDEATKIQRGLKVEDGMFYVSRAYVPLALFSMYRAGIFEQNFSSLELKKVIKVAIAMQAIDLFGHFLMKQITSDIQDKYIGINENAFAYKKKQMFDDYLIQKDYFKNKKDNEDFKRF
eukprot:403333936